MSDQNMINLGISQDELREQVIARAAEKAVEMATGQSYLDEDGEPYYVSRINEAISRVTAEAVTKYADERVAPLINEHIDKVTFTLTNQWGEQKGRTLTFREYLAERAEAWLQETVNHNGKTKGEDSYSFRGATTRISYLIDKHLQFHIENAMKDALKQANNAIAGGIEQAIKMKLAEVLNGLKLKVETK
jgi:hypothetical protein